MTANVRAFPTGCASGQLVPHATFDVLDQNGAYAIRRTATGSGWRMMPFRAHPEFNSSGTQLMTPSYNGVTCKNNAGDIYAIFDNMMHGHVLDKVKLNVLPAPGHGAQPAVLPSMLVFKQTYGSASVTTLDTVTYSWVDISTYEAGFDLLVDGLGEFINNATYSYGIKFTLESGSNSVSGSTVSGLRVYSDIDVTLGGTDFSFWI